MTIKSDYIKDGWCTADARVCVLTSKSIHNNGFGYAMPACELERCYHKSEEGLAFSFEFTIHHATSI